MTVRVMGVDPGLARVGVAVLEEGARPCVLEAYVAATTKGKGKRTDDDVSRMRMIWANIAHTFEEYQPQTIAVEAYTVFKGTQGGQGRGAGWKAIYAYSMTCALGFSKGVKVMSFMPSELKLGVTQNKSAGKYEVEHALYDLVDGMREKMDQTPPGDREHAADAIGHAFLALKRG